MPHLSPDRLAELADSEPTAAERQHLDACALCAAERSAHERVLTVAHLERERLMPPLVTWDTLSEQLHAEGLIKPQTSSVRPRAWATSAMRAAAAVVLVVGGAAFGRYTANGPIILRPTATGTATTPVADEGPGFGSREEAVAALTEAQQTYLRAAAYLAAKNGDSTGGANATDYRRRLAALDDLTGAVRGILYQVPDDPGVNQMYLQTLGQREQALHNYGSALPVRTRLTSY